MAQTVITWRLSIGELMLFLSQSQVNFAVTHRCQISMGLSADWPAPTKRSLPTALHALHKHPLSLLNYI